MSRQLVIRSCLVIWSFIHVTSFGNPSMSRHLVIHSCLVIRSSIHVSSFGHPSMSRQLAIHPCLVIWSSIHVSSFGHPSMSCHLVIHAIHVSFGHLSMSRHLIIHPCLDIHHLVNLVQFSCTCIASLFIYILKHNIHGAHVLSANWLSLSFQKKNYTVYIVVSNKCSCPYYIILELEAWTTNVRQMFSFFYIWLS